MRAYSRNRETDYSPCYFKEKPSFFNYDDNTGYGRAFRVKEKKERSNRDNRWSIIKPIGVPINTTERKFNLLATKWKDETGFYSTTQQKVYNKYYLSIISMGEDVIPFILKDIKNGGTWHWHTALSIIADDNPVPLEDMSRSKKVKEYWIKWGESKNYI